jgi:hypothetical protein
MRILLGSIALLCVGTAHAQFKAALPPVVYLSIPGGLDALARDNPKHYEKARAIIASAERQPQSGIFLTTYPPKQNVRFWIDEVEYRAIVTLSDWRVGHRWDPNRPSPRR